MSVMSILQNLDLTSIFLNIDSSDVLRYVDFWFFIHMSIELLWQSNSKLILSPLDHLQNEIAVYIGTVDIFSM